MARASLTDSLAHTLSVRHERVCAHAFVMFQPERSDDARYDEIMYATCRFVPT